MKFAKYLVALPLFVACLGPAKAGSDINYAIETSRFDFVITFDSQPNPKTGLIDENPAGDFDIIICNQSNNMGEVDVVNPSLIKAVAPMRCLFISCAQDIRAKDNPQPWHGIIYGRFREGCCCPPPRQGS